MSRIIASIGVLLVIAPAAHAVTQEGQTVYGFVVDKNSRAPVNGAVVSAGDRGVVYTDEHGHFEITDVAEPEIALDVRRIGYEPVGADVSLDSAQQRLTLIIAMTPTPLTMAPIRVLSDASEISAPQLAGFYQRRDMGTGTFLTSEEIERALPRKVTDLFYTVPGVRVTPCGDMGTDNCVEFPRQVTVGSSCPPVYYIDGLRVADGGGLQRLDIDDLIQPETIAGIEVYVGVAQTPPRFNTVGNCGGVIVIWTK